MNTNDTLARAPFHVQGGTGPMRDGFPYFSHHDSVWALWSRKWRMPCAHNIYPFTDGDVSDFDPIFAELAARSADNPGILYRPDDYAEPFLPVAAALTRRADDAGAAGDVVASRTLYLRAAAVYRIARFPIIRSPLGEDAWALGKAAYEKGGLLLDPPSLPVDVPFAHADPLAGDRAVPIQAYLRLPKGTPPAKGWPVLLFICGLDAYRTDHTPRTQQHVDQGFATLSFEIPGTGDCPAAPGDPDSPDRLMSSVLDWVAASAGERSLDPASVFARGISTGGYYAFRLAHTHADRLVAVVAQGGGCHFMFDPTWIKAQDQMEYPFSLAPALAYKFGHRGPDADAALVSYAAEAGKFSLLDAGILARPSCRLLVINGMEDSIFPIEDSLLVATRGHRKDLVVRGDRGHMGNPGAEDILYRWIEDVRAGKP